MTVSDADNAVQLMTYTQEYDHGVIAVDAAFVRPRMAAAYIVKCGSHAVIIETGTANTVAHIMKALERHEIAPDDVTYVMPTHVHLDHAGGAGRLLQLLPNAQLLIHERGLRHLIDPSRLERSARQVYGDETFDHLYGSLTPVAAERARAVLDGEVVTVDGRHFEFADTPGHAAHHYCVWDVTSCGWFSGDTFGISYRELDTEQGAYIFPTTTPIQFDPDAMRASIGKLMAREPRWMYLTHFGRVGEVSELSRKLLAGIDQLVALAEAAAQHPARENYLHSEIRDWLRRDLAQHGWRVDDRQWQILMEPDIALNTQGLEYWLDHR